MSLLLNYQPLFEAAEYTSGAIHIRGLANVIVTGEMRSPASAHLHIIGKAFLRLNTKQMHPVIEVLIPKQASINSYILRHNSELEFSTHSTHIEIEQRRPEIKVIDID